MTVEQLEKYACDGTCGRRLPLAIEISNLLGKGTGRQYFERGEALAIDERSMGDFACNTCIGNTISYRS